MNSTKNSIQHESQPIAKQAVSSNCLPFFNRIVEINQNNGWKNPVFIPNTTEEFKNQFFTVQVDDFLEIEDNYEVNVFRVSKRWGEIIIYCRLVFN